MNRDEADEKLTELEKKKIEQMDALSVVESEVLQRKKDFKSTKYAYEMKMYELSEALSMAKHNLEKTKTEMQYFSRERWKN